MIFRRKLSFKKSLFFLPQAGPSVLLHLSTSCSSPAVSSASSSLLRLHHPLCFSLYVSLLMRFVLLLDANYLRSYALLAWSHMFLLLACVPGQMMNSSTFNGLIW